jgi:tetratricopeptide (TPR) repeat protein
VDSERLRRDAWRGLHAGLSTTLRFGRDDTFLGKASARTSVEMTHLRVCAGVAPIIEGMRSSLLQRCDLVRCFSLILLGITAVAAGAQQVPAMGGRVVLVLPFDNRTGDASLNWIGDSFPDTLDKRLESAGFLTISHDDRVFALEHLGLPAGFKPSRATTIRIAQQVDANFVIFGSYTVDGVTAPKTDVGKAAKGAASDDEASTAPARQVASSTDRLHVEAQVLSIDELKLSAQIQDAAELYRLFDAENAVAWKAAKLLDPRFNVAEPTFLAAQGSVPLAAFEDYIRGTSSTSSEERLKRLQAAVGLVPGYPAALLALGKEQYEQRNYDAAAATLAKVPKTDRLALEANFYLGLARFNTANYAGAAEAFGFVTTRLPLSEIINNEAVAMSRQGKDATPLFQRAVSEDPSDEDYHYNLAVSFFRRGDTTSAMREVDEALKLKATDAEATALKKQLGAVPAGTKLTANSANFTAVERIRRNYPETSFRQAAFLLDQTRAARLAALPADERAAQYAQLGREYLAEGLLPEAESQFHAAIEADPRSSEAHAGLAQIRDTSGDATQARNEANTSNGIKPNAAAYMVLARLD